MKNEITTLNCKLNTLTIFRGLLAIPVISRFQILANAFKEDLPAEIIANNYCEFVSELYKKTPDLERYIYDTVLKDENFYVKAKARKSAEHLMPTVTKCVEDCLDRELDILQEFMQCKSVDVKNLIVSQETSSFISSETLPSWDNSKLNLKTAYKEMIKNLAVTGYGIYAKYRAFCIKKGTIVPVKYPDTQKLSSLFRYERERDLIIKNTEALISGNGANNMLLYGDAGTGKSSTIKAVANAYADQGLRLIEVKKNQLYEIPDIVEELSANPLKFILFIDDLSFASNDDNFSALKAVLEGSVSAFGDNVAIYATSNRRHLVKENMSDRTGDDLHINDTLQETMSLAARFGLTITFGRPGKDDYLNIVENLAKEYELDIPKDELFALAERHALRCNGRSPRVAKQFIELQKIGL